MNMCGIWAAISASCSQGCSCWSSLLSPVSVFVTTLKLVSEETLLCVLAPRVPTTA